MFIVFEGIEHSGKTTQAGILALKLRDKLGPNKILQVREPGSTVLGERIRRLLLHTETTNIDPLAEMMLFMAARAQLIKEVIVPALDGGIGIIADRFLFSTYAYQHSVSWGAIEKVGLVATDGVKPDLIFIFDIPVSVAMERMGGQRDTIESRPQEYHEKVRAKYRQLAETYSNVVLVDGLASIEENEKKVWHNIVAFFPQLGG